MAGLPCRPHASMLLRFEVRIEVLEPLEFAQAFGTVSVGALAAAERR